MTRRPLRPGGCQSPSFRRLVGGDASACAMTLAGLIRTDARRHRARRQAALTWSNGFLSELSFRSSILAVASKLQSEGRCATPDLCS
jgi:hypothetical protein